MDVMRGGEKDVKMNENFQVVADSEEIKSSKIMRKVKMYFND